MDLKEKGVESNPNLEVVLHIAPQSQSYAFNYPNAGIKVNIIKEALLLLSLSKLGNGAISDVFPIDTWYLFFTRPLKLGPRIVCHERLNFQVQTVTLNPLNSTQPQTPQKIKAS